jgi:hypothetical protein
MSTNNKMPEEEKTKKQNLDSKTSKDDINLKPVYIKPSKEILNIIPFCNNIYTVQRNES